ncbi:hypothetical protein C6N75_16450 [Streptomyces solincola]|uniref:Uncharacterized protein n=1 Tax=Streptomyces solincola TaxID=2100817 RepID=A0A2S9PUR1_9ACTN|nr:hypothetical protein [Streptomyces solincola]PRH78149.1 hypothetical protein C6N75_16450 [Streptomyces solincola]
MGFFSRFRRKSFAVVGEDTAVEPVTTEEPAHERVDEPAAESAAGATPAADGAVTESAQAGEEPARDAEPADAAGDAEEAGEAAEAGAGGGDAAIPRQQTADAAADDAADETARA